MKPKPVPCPKCSRLLQPAGIATCDGQEYPTYQCDKCVQTIKMFGELIENAPYTFCIGPDGKPFDPAEGTDFS